LCIAPSGAVVALDQPGQALTAVAYEDDANDAVLSLPGPLAAPPASPPFA